MRVRFRLLVLLGFSSLSAGFTLARGRFPITSSKKALSKSRLLPAGLARVLSGNATFTPLSERTVAGVHSASDGHSAIRRSFGP